MKRINIKCDTKINRNESVIGEYIETKIKRAINTMEAIEENAPIIYTPRAEGVKPEYNIRTDRFDVALDAVTKYHEKKMIQRAEYYKAKETKSEVDTVTEVTVE